jgi:hypothetical protein
MRAEYSNGEATPYYRRVKRKKGREEGIKAIHR